MIFPRNYTPFYYFRTKIPSSSGQAHVRPINHFRPTKRPKNRTLIINSCIRHFLLSFFDWRLRSLSLFVAASVLNFPKYSLFSQSCVFHWFFYVSSSHFWCLTFDVVEAEMKVVAAYLLAVLGGNTNPGLDDVKSILNSGSYFTNYLSFTYRFICYSGGFIAFVDRVDVIRFGKWERLGFVRSECLG